MGINRPNKSDESGIHYEERDYATKTEMENISEPSVSDVGKVWTATGEGEASFQTGGGGLNLTGSPGDSGEKTETDDFNRADSGMLGSPWVNSSGSFGVVSNQATPTTDSGGVTRSYWDVMMPNLDASIDITYTGDNDSFSFFFRHDGTLNNRFLWYYSSGLVLRKVVDGASTIILTEPYTPPTGVAVTYRTVVTDDGVDMNVKVYADAVLIIDHTESNVLEAYGAIAIQSYISGSIGASKYDNLTVTGFVTDEGNAWSEADWVAYGDSITYQQLYVNAVMERLLFDTVTNRGVSNQTITDNVTGSATNAGVDDVKGDSGFSGFELVSMYWGTNDFYYGSPLGTLGVIGDTEFNEDTFYGAYRSAIEHVLSDDPEAKIMLICPTQRNRNGFDVNTVNAAGNKLIDYVDAIIAIANLYGLPYVDLYRESGFVGDNTFTGTIPTFAPDGLHPNELGAQRCGDVIARKVVSSGLRK